MCTRAVQGRGRCARARRQSSIPTTSHALATFSGGGSWAESLLQTAHRRIPTEGVQFRASPSWFRPRPFVPGLFWFRARVILLDFCKMDVGPIFFKEILFFDFLEESTQIFIWTVVKMQEGKSRNKIFPSQSRPNVHFAEVHIPLLDGPTRPTPRLPVRGAVPTFAHAEPPPLVFLLEVAPSSGPNRSVPSNSDGSGVSTW
jgi:hypothetical protein